MEIKDMSQEEKEQRIKEILEAFRNFDGKYKREEVDDAVELKEEITPYLIEILEGVRADPTEYIENEEYIDHLYALMLLGYFREAKAHQVIIDIFSLPDDMTDILFGDLITESLSSLLIDTSGGETEPIKSLILNQNAYEFCRTSACYALTYGVIKDYITREEALTFFETIFADAVNKYEESPSFLGSMGDAVSYLYPVEIMDTIKLVFEKKLIDEMIIIFKHFEDEISRGKENSLKKIKMDMEYYGINDIHEMAQWPCFEDMSFPSGGHASPLPQSAKDALKLDKKLERKKTQAKKSKKKQAKKSKKKNRGKKKKK